MIRTKLTVMLAVLTLVAGNLPAIYWPKRRTG